MSFNYPSYLFKLLRGLDYSFTPLYLYSSEIILNIHSIHRLTVLERLSAVSLFNFELQDKIILIISFLSGISPFERVDSKVL